MTPQEKAKEIFDKMCQTIGSNCEHDSYCEEGECKWKGMIYCKVAQNEAKQCALIALDELINEASDEIYQVGRKCNDYVFWKQVKEEIIKL